nr:retrovirus-related Pol polyprotein from transposon TNT 1-94 [Tanacetum cinerariifolium]
MSLITLKEVRKFRLQRPRSPPKSGFTKKTNPSLLSVQRHIREPIWYLNSGCSRSMTGVKSYLHKYIEQPGPKIVFGDNSSCITEGYGSINFGGIVFTKVAFVNGLKYNLISISQLCEAKILYCMICKKEDHRTADHEMHIASFKRSENYKAQPYQYASTSKQILKAKAKPFPPCTHYGFNDYRPDDCRNYPECE